MYDVAIIGSGYGGAVCAARLAPGARVVIIERGRRWSSGEFPETLASVTRAYVRRDNPLGLWELRVGRGTGNGFARGFGGGSLVNYGITAQPEAHVFEQWPISAAELAPFYERARAVLRPSVNPLAATLADREFLDHVEPGRRVDLENTIDWALCRQCGNCVPGCNHGAKRSLDKTYLALAEAAGADVLVEREAVRIERANGAGSAPFVVRLRPTAGGPSAATESIEARHVVVAAGTFGTLDLLERHRDVFALSPRFGDRMSMNGDALAFLYNTRFPLSGVHGAPISTTARLPFTDADNRTRTLTVMAGRIPGSVVAVSSALLAVAAGTALGQHVAGDAHDGYVGGVASVGRRVSRRLLDLAGAARGRGPGAGGAVDQTVMYKLDAQDQSVGRASWDALGRASIDWPGYADDPILRFAGRRLERWAARVGGTLVPNLGTLLGLPSFGVHPLGGCSVGHDVGAGVVDGYGRVFNAGSSERGALHSGLRVIDASVLPSSLGVPPSFTIAAIAERGAEHLAAEIAAERVAAS